MFYNKFLPVLLISSIAYGVSPDPTKAEQDFFDQLLNQGSMHADFKDPASRADVINKIQTSSEVAGYTITSLQYPVATPKEPRAQSGQASLCHGLLSYYHQSEPSILTDPIFEEQIAPLWNPIIVSERSLTLLKDFIADHLLRCLAHTKEVSVFDLGRNDKFFYLSGSSKAVLISSDLERPQKNEIIYTGKLCLAAAESLAERFHDDFANLKAITIALTRDIIYAELVAQTASVTSTSGVTFDKEVFNASLPTLTELSGTLVQSNNKHEFITETDNLIRSYGPLDTETTYPDGSFVTSAELRSLSKKEKKQPSACFNTKRVFPTITTLEFPKEADIEAMFMTNLELTVISDALAKDPDTYELLLLIGKEFEAGIMEWISCLIIKDHADINLIITDPQNKDRLEDATIQRVRQALHDGIQKKGTLPKENNRDLDDLFAIGEPTKKKESKKEDAVNYDAPLSSIPLEELETLEDLFGGTIPNEIRIIMQFLKHPELNNTGASARIKNCILLHGPPGTGKSTIAQVLPRLCGWDVVYAGGGDFRTAYQGSGKAKIDAFFAEVDKRGHAVAFIDEIDGTTSKLQPNGSTQEDGRTIKAFLTALDQRRHDKGSWTIFTTNHIDMVDDAFRRRCIVIEIPLPHYAGRKRIIDKYLGKLGIPLGTHDDAISPMFYDKLLNATEGFSGDKIIDMLVLAKLHHNAGLEPEMPIGFSWRLKGFNWSNKSLLANMGEAMLLPLAPAFHALSDTPMERHVYSQYIRRIKEIDAIEELEWLRDPRNNNHKYSWSRVSSIYAREAMKSVVHGVFSSIGSNLATTVGTHVKSYMPSFSSSSLVDLLRAKTTDDLFDTDNEDSVEAL